MTKATAGYALRKPCAKCPFRTDVQPYLSFERAKEIAAGLRDHGSFFCHRTVDYDDQDEDADEYVTQGTEQQCAGATILQENDGGLGQLLRIAERIGIYDRSRMDLDAPVYTSIDDWVGSYRPETGDDDSELEHCGVVGPDCQDPAGYAYGSSVGENPDPPTCDPDNGCIECGSAMCESCRADHKTCIYCAEANG
jgi:hypothetical protein